MSISPVSPVHPSVAQPPASLRIVAWTDPVIDTLGHDPRSWYVEQFWLPIVGPTTTWLLRRIVARFDDAPDGFELDLDDTARALGVGREGRHSPFRRALARSAAFKLCRPHGPGALAVRRRLPPLSRRHVDRLPPSVQEAHAAWTTGQDRSSVTDATRDRARRLAVKLLDIGADRHAVELQLVRWRVHPTVAEQATAWALTLAASC